MQLLISTSSRKFKVCTFPLTNNNLSFFEFHWKHPTADKKKFGWIHSLSVWLAQHRARKYTNNSVTTKVEKKHNSEWGRKLFTLAIFCFAQFSSIVNFHAILFVARGLCELLLIVEVWRPDTCVNHNVQPELRLPPRFELHVSFSLSLPLFSPV